MAREKCVLAYSGGLDTSVCIQWLINERDLDVITLLVDVGQDCADLEFARQKALNCGAIESIVMDVRDEFCEDMCCKAIAANGLYENKYPLLSALSRPLISAKLVEVAHKYGATYIAHGCTGKGNDQVRFEVSVQALDPDLKVIAPVRVWDLHTRPQEIAFAEAHGIPVAAKNGKPYSIDDNLWGRAIECGVLEDPWNEPPADIWETTADLADCPDTPEDVIVGFEGGKPCSLDGEKMSVQDVIVKLDAIAGRNGYGRLDQIENRLVGIKSRECYECPAALLLIQAHQSLEQLCLDAETLKQKAKLDVEWASTVYRGLWFSQNRNAIDAFNAYTQKYVTGDVRIILCKGGLFVDGLRSDYSLYDYNLATYDEGDTFDHTAARGFIDLHGLQSKTWSRVQGPGSGLQPVE